MGKDPAQTTVSRLLAELQEGSDTALDELFALLYEELRDLAHRQHQRWRDDHTLDTTGLLHEAFLKLVGRSNRDVESRAHFLALASRVMRHILCNSARDRQALQRGGAMTRLPLDDSLALAAPAHPAEEATESLLALDEALKRLAQVDARASKVVECRFFAGSRSKRRPRRSASRPGP